MNLLILIHRQRVFLALCDRADNYAADGNLQQQQDETSQIKGVRVHLLVLSLSEPARIQKKDASIVLLLRALLHLKRGRRAVCVVLDVCDIVRKKREISTLMFTALILGRCERIDTSKVRMHAGREQERDAQRIFCPRAAQTLGWMQNLQLPECWRWTPWLSLIPSFFHTQPAGARVRCGSAWKTLAYFAACRRPIKSQRHVPDLHRASFSGQSVCEAAPFPPFLLSAGGGKFSGGGVPILCSLCAIIWLLWRQWAS